ncbi:unnamed protein product, partial [Effrenium voratum]
DVDISEDIEKFKMPVLEEPQGPPSCSHLIKGKWRPDGGPGSAVNPQVQLATQRLTMIRAELRSPLLETNSTLEIWLLSGTHWGQRVKDLSPENEEDQGGGEDQLLTEKTQAMLKEQEETKKGARRYQILSSAQSLVVRPGPVRVQLECEVPRGETLTIVVTRGRHTKVPSKEETPPERKGSNASEASNARRSSSMRNTPATPRRSSRRLSMQMSVPEESVGSESGTPRNGRRMSTRRKSSQHSQLPQLPTLERLPSAVPEESGGGLASHSASVAPEAAAISVAPDVLMPAHKAMVRGWTPEDSDHFELRIWTTTRLKRGPELIKMEEEPREAQVDPYWQGRVSTVREAFNLLETAHEASLWTQRADVAWNARVGLNKDLDLVLADLRKLQQMQKPETDFFKYCNKYSLGGFTLLDCVGKELGTRY